MCQILQVSSALDGQSGLDDVGQECPAGAKSDTAVTSPPVAAGGAGGAAEGGGDLRVRRGLPRFGSWFAT